MIEKIGYLGPAGTYSHVAATGFAQDTGADSCKIIAYPSFPALMCALKGGECDAVVMPVENTLNGAVVQNLDLLQSTEGVWACAARSVKVEHRLITLKGADYAAIKRIYSHEQALAQCGRYLFENFPSAELITTQSTAESVTRLKNGDEAAIAGGQCAAEGLQLSDGCISDEPDNYTQFLLVTRGSVPDDRKSSDIFFSFTCQHRSGALYETLSSLAESGINMNKIESRPIKDRTGEFRFFIEIEGDYSAPSMKKALATLAQRSTSLKIIGCY